MILSQEDEKVHTAKTRDRAATETALVRAAIESFSRIGYDRSTTKDIARAAGCAETLIQRYFNGKKGLLLEVIKRGSSGSVDRLAQPHEFPKKLEDELLRLFELSFASLDRAAPILRIAMSLSLVDEEFQRTFNGMSTQAERITAYEKRLRHYQEKGLINMKLNLRDQAEILASTFMHFGFIRRHVMRIEEIELRRQAQVFCLVLARGLAPVAATDNKLSGGKKR